ncbi:hypothetical protein CCP4SC76_7640006 [Gammaproteobacteria bacterium]
MAKLYEVEITHKGYVIVDLDDEITNGDRAFHRYKGDIVNDDCYPEYSWIEVKEMPKGEDPEVGVYHNGKNYITISEFFEYKLL